MAKTIEEKADNKYYLQNALENVFLLQGDRIKSAKKKAILEIQSGRMDWALIMLDNCIFRTRAEANAKLIAAAPELLNACFTAKAMFEAQGINKDSRIGGEQYSQLLNAIKEATK